MNILSSEIPHHQSYTDFKEVRLIDKTVISAHSLEDKKIAL